MGMCDEDDVWWKRTRPEVIAAVTGVIVRSAIGLLRHMSYQLKSYMGACMGYHLPTFNLVCNIWIQVDPGTSIPKPAPDLTGVPCNLQFARKIGSLAGFASWVLLPKLTDVRSISLLGTSVSMIECPAGSERWYIVSFVDDSMKGFATEYRVASCEQTMVYGGSAVDPQWFWPTPYP